MEVVARPRECFAPRKELEALTAFRGIAAILVALFHLDLEIDLGGLLLSRGDLWVDFFFCLSGFVLSHAYGKQFEETISFRRVGAFIAARLARIYPMHLVMLLAFAGLELIFAIIRAIMPSEDLPWFIVGGFISESSDVTAFLLNLMLVHAWGLPEITWNGVSWSISAELLAYLAFPVICLTMGYLTPWAIVLLGLLSTAASLFLMSYDHGFDVTTQLGAARCLSEFMVGVILYRAYTSKGIRRWLGLDLVVAILIIAATVAMMRGSSNIVVLLLLFVLVPALASNDGVFNRLAKTSLLQYPGLWSYSIYMIHILVMDVILSVLQLYTGSESWAEAVAATNKYLVAVLFIGSVIFLSWATYHMVEIPGRRKIQLWRKLSVLDLSLRPTLVQKRRLFEFSSSVEDRDSHPNRGQT